MISALDVVRQYHTEQYKENQDLKTIEVIIRENAAKGLRECNYPITVSDYSLIMNNLKELGYTVSSQPNVRNNKITELTIKW